MDVFIAKVTLNYVLRFIMGEGGGGHIELKTGLGKYEPLHSLQYYVYVLDLKLKNNVEIGFW